MGTKTIKKNKGTKCIKAAMDRCLDIALKEHKKNNNVDKKLIKILEEAGEFAAAYLMHIGSKGTNKTKEEVKDNLLEEGCDVCLVALSIVMRHGFTIEEIAEKLQTKMDKWEKQVASYKKTK